MLIGAWNIQLIPYSLGFFDNADYFTLFEVNFFAVYYYYSGSLIIEFFNK